MILRPGDKAGILPAVRNVGDAVPQGADSGPVHAAERLGICDSGSDKARIGRHARIRWRTRAASIRFHSAIVTPVWNTSITKSTEAEACARRGLATKSAGGGEGRYNAETGARHSTPTRASYARAPRKGRIS
jgi:hypothetical protein